MTVHPTQDDVRTVHTDLDPWRSSGRVTAVALASVDRAAQRCVLAESLAAAADGDRVQLEDRRSVYLHRLHRTSADFDATEGLRTVELALSMIPRPDGLWAWQRQERDHRRRWWNRQRPMA